MTRPLSASMPPTAGPVSGTAAASPPALSPWPGAASALRPFPDRFDTRPALERSEPPDCFPRGTLSPAAGIPAAASAFSWSCPSTSSFTIFAARLCAPFISCASITFPCTTTFPLCAMIHWVAESCASEISRERSSSGARQWRLQGSRCALHRARCRRSAPGWRFGFAGSPCTMRAEACSTCRARAAA